MTTKQTIRIPTSAVLSEYQKDRLRHALNVASQELRSNAAELEIEGQKPATEHAIFGGAAALSFAKDYRTYAGEMDELIERLDGTLFIAFVEEED